MEKNSLGTDVLLVCKKMEIEHKSFCFELKENSEIQYLQISQKGGFSILLLSSGISCFLEALDCFSSSPSEHLEEGFVEEKELKINDKVFCFNVGQNKCGHFLKVSEASTSTNCRNITIPCGKDKNKGLQLFRRTMEEIGITARVLFPPHQQQQQIFTPSEQPMELADAKTDFIMSHDAQSSSAPQSKVEPARYESNSCCDSKMMRVDQKQFFFDLGNNKRGHFLKISEGRGTWRSSVIIPLSQLKQFNEMVGHFLQITNDSYPREGHLTDKNVKKWSSPQISETQVLNAEDESCTSGELI